jgi:chromosome-anchoring protein RacA
VQGSSLVTKKLSLQVITGGIKMEALIKTKEVSEELGVNVKTVRKWVNFFGIACKRNDNGHFEFKNDDVQNLKIIQKELGKGIPMKEVLVSLEDKQVSKEDTIESVELVEQKFDKIFFRLDQLERKIHQKADDVLSYQVLQHRKELEAISDKITAIEERLLNVESNVYKEVAASKY